MHTYLHAYIHTYRNSGKLTRWHTHTYICTSMFVFINILRYKTIKLTKNLYVGGKTYLRYRDPTHTDTVTHNRMHARAQTKPRIKIIQI